MNRIILLIAFFSLFFSDAVFGDVNSPVSRETFDILPLSKADALLPKPYVPNQVAKTEGVKDVPDAPTKLKAKPLSHTSIEIKWDHKGKDVDAFRIERSFVENFFYNEISTVPADVYTYEDRSLFPFTNYYYRVRAVGEDGVSEPSKVASARTGDDVAEVPLAPSGLSASATSASDISLSWTDNSDSEEEYIVQRAFTSDGTFEEIASLPENSEAYTHSGLTPNTTYYYQVLASNESGDSEASNKANAITDDVAPAAPNNLTSSVFSSNRIDLSWVDNADNEDNYIVEASSPTNENFSPIVTLPAGTTTFNHTGLSSATTYYYRVKAQNEIDDSDYSNTTNATTTDVVPAAPTGLTVSSATASEINLSWTDNASNEDNFIVEMSSPNNDNFAPVSTLGANVTTYSHTGLSPNTRYYYKVKAQNEVDGSGYSNTVNTTTLNVAPVAPSGLAASVISKSQINLSWADNANNEENYILERSTPGSDNFEVIATLPAGTTTYSHTGLISNTRYYYKVKARNDIDDSGYSNTVNARTSADLPILAPSNLRITEGTTTTTSINLAWNDNSDNETSFVLERTLTPANKESFVVIAELSQNQTSYQDTELTSNTTYFYRVLARNKDGGSPYSNEVSETTIREEGPPAAPTGLAATAITTFQINLEWNDNADNETNYLVERSNSPDGPFAQVITLPANSDSYENTGLAANTRYYYRVTARNIDGTSGSNVASATTKAIAIPPAAPSGLSATAVSTVQINLSWTDNSNSETNFDIERAASLLGPYELIASVGANVTSYQNFGLTSNTRYYYRVRAANGDGASLYSNVANARTAEAPQPPVAPSGLAATGVSTSQINLTWNDNSENETGFVVERANSADGNFSFVGSVGANVTMYQNTGLTANKQYFYKVRAINNDGTSGFSNTASGTTLNEPKAPSPPSGLVANGVSTTQINLSWEDNSASETNFEVYRSGSSNGTFTFLANVPANVTTYENTGLEANSTYYYRVLASNGDGKSTFSNTSQASTSSVPLPPDAPDGLTALAVSTTQIVLRWNDKASNETGYEIERAIGEATFEALPVTANANDTTFQNFGLTANTNYRYRIRAFNEDGVSSYSNVAEATTPSQEMPPTAPSDLFGKVASLSEVELFWTDNSNNEREFIVQRAELSDLNQTEANFSIVERLPDNTTTYIDSEIEENKIYRYRIQAENSDGISFSNEVNIITSVGGNPIISIISSVFPKYFPQNTADTTATLRAGEAESIREMLFFYRGLAEEEFKEKSVVVDGDIFEATILEEDLDEMGLEYYFQAEDLDGNLSVSPKGYLYNLYQGNGQTIPNLRFGETVQDYQMISIPMSLTQGSIREVLEDDLGPYNTSQWRIFHYENDEVKFIERGDFTALEPGKGYWLIAKESTAIDTGAGTVVESNQDSPFVIRLQPGWNQIGNPYPFDIAWNSLLSANGNPETVGPLYSYNGQLVENPTLEVFGGAYVHADETIELKIPLTGNASSSGKFSTNTLNTFSKDSKPEGWKLDFLLQSGAVVYNLAGLGMHPGASQSKDKFDRIALPRLSSSVDVNFSHPEYITPQFTRDVVPLQENYIWDMEVVSEGVRGSVNISWNKNIDLPKGMQLYLYNPSNETIVNMREVDNFQVANQQELKVFYGSDSFIEKELRPQGIKIGQLYPNPFQEKLGFSLALPSIDGKEYEVNVLLYNSLGQEVSRSVGKMVEGFQHFELDLPSRLSRGIYIYKVSVGLNGKIMEEKTGRLIRE